MTIHSEHPFAPGPEERDPARRFRGRLVAPVTVVTAGDGESRTGLTVSSLLLVEGDPAVVQLVVTPNSDLWDVIADTGRFVIHILGEAHNTIADIFAGLRPNPGGIFAGSNTRSGDWGPVLDDITDRAYCSLQQREEVGYSGVVTGVIDDVELTELTGPLTYFRGRYRGLSR